jgi:hypothetical protein
VKALFRKARADEAHATIAEVTMTERRSYGEAKVRVTYLVTPAGGTAFEVTREVAVKMTDLPQAGQGLRVLCDPANRELVRVLTPPGQEAAPPPGSAPTKEIPWNDAGQANWWANGTRRR